LDMLVTLGFPGDMLTFHAGTQFAAFSAGRMFIIETQYASDETFYAMQHYRPECTHEQFCLPNNTTWAEIKKLALRDPTFAKNLRCFDDELFRCPLHTDKLFTGSKFRKHFIAAHKTMVSDQSKVGGGVLVRAGDKAEVFCLPCGGYKLKKHHGEHTMSDGHAILTHEMPGEIKLLLTAIEHTRAQGKLEPVWVKLLKAQSKLEGGKPVKAIPCPFCQDPSMLLESKEELYAHLGDLDYIAKHYNALHDRAAKMPKPFDWRGNKTDAEQAKYDARLKDAFQSMLVSFRLHIVVVVVQAVRVCVLIRYDAVF
jgi:hypothetical protein